MAQYFKNSLFKANPGSRLKPNLELAQQQSMPSPERLSSSTGTSLQFQTEQADEDDEEEMLRNMPWLKAFPNCIIPINQCIQTLLEFCQRFDLCCPHEHYCPKWCFERVYRQCNRLLEALLVIHGQIAPEGRVDRRQQFIERWQSGQQDARVSKRSPIISN